MITTHNESRLSGILFAQAIRQIEEAGPLEDGQAMREAFRGKSGREERLIERASILARRLKLDRELERWQALAPYVALALSAFVFSIAYGIAAAVVGQDRSINAVLAFVVLLGMHAATLVLWGAGTIVTLRSQRPRMAAPISLGNLFVRLLAWLPIERGPYSPVMARAAMHLLQRAKLLPWVFGLISHLIWALAFLLVLAALWFAFSFREYRLTWETTILSADFFVRFVRVTGWLPHLLGFPLPDTATLLSPGAAGGGQRAWAWWLIGCTFIYGLVPRVALVGLSWLFWRRGRRSLRLDTSDPYFRKLLTRFEAMEVSTVVDPEQRPDPASLAGDTLHSQEPHEALAIIGFELPAEQPWPPGRLADPAALAVRIAGASQERRALLDTLAQARPCKTLIACHATSSPDRGTERFIREACAYSTECSLLLLPPGGDNGNAQRWQSWLRDAGMTDIPVFADFDSAAAWFKPAHA